MQLLFQVAICMYVRSDKRYMHVCIMYEAAQVFCLDKQDF